MDEKRKPLSPHFWTAAGLMVLAAYPLSLGPVEHLGNCGIRVLPFFARGIYQPIWWIVEHGPFPLDYMIVAYVRWWDQLSGLTHTD